MTNDAQEHFLNLVDPNFHDASLDSFAMRPGDDSDSSSIIEMVLSYRHADISFVVKLEGCANVSFDIDLDVLVHNHPQSIAFLKTSDSQEEISALISSQVKYWNVRYGDEPVEEVWCHNDEPSPMEEKLSRIAEYSLHTFKIFGGHIKIVSRRMSVKRVVPAIERSKNESEQCGPDNSRPCGTSVMSPADPASRAGDTPEASGSI